MHDYFDRWPAWTRSIRWELNDPDGPEDDDLDDDEDTFTEDDIPDEDPTIGEYPRDASEDDIPF